MCLHVGLGHAHEQYVVGLGATLWSSDACCRDDSSPFGVLIKELVKLVISIAASVVDDALSQVVRSDSAILRDQVVGGHDELSKHGLLAGKKDELADRHPCWRQSDFGRDHGVHSPVDLLDCWFSPHFAPPRHRLRVPRSACPCNTMVKVVSPRPATDRHGVFGYAGTRVPGRLLRRSAPW